jgi:signal transduction histidine kinase
MARALLGPSRTQALDAQVTRLTDTRSRVVDATEAERRRIERDLHDGAQQRLVALAMNLGRAQDKFDSDPAAARTLVDEAHREAKHALVELRDLARGIHPAVLTDRGLDAALSSVAARSSVPVHLSVDVADRPTPTIEGIAYFVVCEALTNVAKHSGARRASITVARRGERLFVEVTDDGHGGAVPALGSGMTGLRDRVEGVDGWLHVSSPVGGPTTLLAEFPCES